MRRGDAARPADRGVDAAGAMFRVLCALTGIPLAFLCIRLMTLADGPGATPVLLTAWGASIALYFAVRGSSRST